jgi:hypothetical protein
MTGKNSNRVRTEVRKCRTTEESLVALLCPRIFEMRSTECPLRVQDRQEVLPLL